MRNIFCLLCLIGSLFCADAYANERLSITSNNFFGKTFGQMWFGVARGFYDSDTEKVNSAGLSMIASSAATAYLLYSSNNDEVQSRQFKLGIGHDPTSIVSKVGNALPYSLLFGYLVAGQFLDPASAEYRKSFEVSVDLASTIGLTYLTTGILKGSIDRARPNNRNYNSFPSNHTAGAFAAAGVVAYNYPLYIGIPSLLAAGAVGLSRVDLAVHFPSDVVAGAGIGLAYATAIAYQRGRRDNDYLLAPIVDEGTYGLSFMKPF